jgi:putative transposase
LTIIELCSALDVPTSTYYDAVNGRLTRGNTPRRSQRRLGDAERVAVLDLLVSEKYIDMSVSEVFYTLLDQDVYYCSISTMYRILRENKAVKERRQLRQHLKYEKPVCFATAPHELWSWDITKLPGPVKGTYFNLYVIIDIYSRYVVGWTVSTKENASQAKALIEGTFNKQKLINHKLTLHSDRGSPMKSRVVNDMLLDLGILRSLSRPRVSNDNPYSEAHFKTLKYHPTFPQQFGSIQDARQFLLGFFDWYNNEHYHQGISMLTPATVHLGKATETFKHRTKTMQNAYQRFPQRFVHGCPVKATLPPIVWINQPTNHVLDMV